MFESNHNKSKLTIQMKSKKMYKQMKSVEFVDMYLVLIEIMNGRDENCIIFVSYRILSDIPKCLLE